MYTKPKTKWTNNVEVISAITRNYRTRLVRDAIDIGKKQNGAEKPTTPKCHGISKEVACIK